MKKITADQYLINHGLMKDPGKKHYKWEQQMEVEEKEEVELTKVQICLSKTNKTDIMVGLFAILTIVLWSFK